MGASVPITRVVDRVQCEVYEAILDLQKLRDENGVSFIRNYVAKAVLTLQVNTDGTIAPDGALLGPFAAGSYAVGLSAGLTGAANRIATYGFTLDFQKANEGWCPNNGYDGFPPLQGQLGMREWLNAVLFSHEPTDPFKLPKSISHRLDFTIDAGIRLLPSYALVRSRDSVALGLHRKDFHTLDIAIEYLSPKDRAAPDYQEVCVVNEPGPCYWLNRKQAPAAAPKISSKSIRKMLPESDGGSPSAPPRTAPARPARVAPERYIPRDVEQKLDRALQNLELRSIGPRF